MQVPEEWGVKLLEDISDKVMVGIASAATHAYSNSGIIMLRNLNIKEGWIDDSDILYITPEYEKSHRNKRLKAGDILTVRTGYPGVSAVVSEKYNNAQCFTSLITRLKQNIAKPEFVCLYINSDYGKRFITSGEAGGAQKNVNAGMLKKMPVPIPPLNVQQKIVQILSTWDKAITTTEQLLANSQQQKKALMQQLLTGKKRLLDENGKRFSGEWKTTQLGKVANMNSGGTPKSTVEEYYGGSIPWVSIADMTSSGKYITETEKYLTEEGLKNSSAKIYPKHTVLYAMYASIGECSIASVELASSQAILGIRPKAVLDYKYLYFYLSSLKEKIKLQGQQGTQSNLNAGMVKEFNILLPPLVEQQKIATVLTTVDQEIAVLEQKLEHLKQENKSLMQQLLTGKKRVKITQGAA